MSGRLELVAGPADAGVPLDVFLASHPEIGSCSAAEPPIDAAPATVAAAAPPNRHVPAAGAAATAAL